MASRDNITPTLLRQLLDYDPLTGEITHRKRPASMFRTGRRCSEANGKTWNTRYAGTTAFRTYSKNGYLMGSIFKYRLLGHRVAFALHHGCWPQGEIDHRNGRRDDNRIANLRDVSRAINAKNKRIDRRNSSGTMGVSFDKQLCMWVAYININKKRKTLGRFKNLHEAVIARRNAENLHDYNINHGDVPAGKYA